MGTSQDADTFAEARADIYDLQGALYRRSKCVSRYFRDEGLLPIPVMGPAGTPPTIVRTHAAYGTRVAEFQYAKDGSPPVYPAPASTGSGDTLMTSDVSVPAPVELADGRLRFGISGTYTFVQPGDGRGTEDQLPIDRHPFFSAIDLLGLTDRANFGAGGQGDYGTYNTGSIDTRYLGSYGILG